MKTKIANHMTVALLFAAACGSPTEDITFAERGQDIIGGFHANSAALNHTGALVVIFPDTGDMFPVCSSTLIGPESVVTAKHCADLLTTIEFQRLGVAWAAGPQALTPLELIPIAAAETAPGDVGGSVGFGRDVAVLHLDHPTSIKPAVPRLATNDLLGKSMVSIGYGVYGALGASDDQRRIGRETVAANEGRLFEIMLGSFENFVEWAFTGTVTDEDFLVNIPPDDPLLEDLRNEFDALQLYDQHEVVTGLAATDTQTCSGDSGGPLALFRRDGTTELYGVVSGGLGSLRSACDFGSVFSTFGPESFAFLQQAMTWVDPCGDVTEQGVCDGNVARTCETQFVANLRRLVEEDCSAAGLECVAGETGVGCGAPPPPEPIEPPDPGAEQIVLDAAEASRQPAITSQLPWVPASAN